MRNGLIRDRDTLPPFGVNGRIIVFFILISDTQQVQHIQTGTQISRLIKQCTIQMGCIKVPHREFRIDDKKMSSLFIDAPQFEPYMVHLISLGNIYRIKESLTYKFILVLSS